MARNETFRTINHIQAPTVREGYDNIHGFLTAYLRARLG
jgi:hypothetical protein